MAGALYAYAYLGSVEPDGSNLDLSFRILFMIIIGGIGSIMGSFLGAAFSRSRILFVWTYGFSKTG